MSKITVRLSRLNFAGVYGATGAAAGAFDTSAPPDAYAARIRNVTILSGNIDRTRGEHAGTPQSYPTVTDRPQD
jgi:hypothetical protein